MRGHYWGSPMFIPRKLLRPPHVGRFPSPSWSEHTHTFTHSHRHSEVHSNLSYISALCSTLPALWCFRVTGWVNVSKCVGASILCSITTEWVWFEDITALIRLTHLPVHCVHSSIPAVSSSSAKLTWCVCKIRWVSMIFIATERTRGDINKG